ncbi:hypothetical protein MNBD_ALPHA06-796 [hydrothermal vent metagenome]|uniref:Uncharacterized protein n=1 Tax=hydrothermal vent metagenome TaxID=652676 RepID=A0A3B0RMW8_9ZZZZ
MKKFILPALLAAFALLGYYVFNQYYKLTPRMAEEGNKTFSIAEFLKEPVCYLEVLKSDVPTENGYLEDVTFIELTYVDTDNVTGPYYYLPAEKDRKTGTISSYAVETVYPDRESYLIKAFYEYDAEGERHIEEQFFMLINGEIRIATGEMKLDDDGTTYIYAEPESIKWTDAYLRSDCKTARSHDSLMGDF